MQYSNKYIVMFAAAVCVVCSIFVSGSAVALKEMQKKNQLLDLQKNVISVSGLIESDKISTLSPEEISNYFKESDNYIETVYIKITNDPNGGKAKIENKDYALPKEYKDANTSYSA